MTNLFGFLVRTNLRSSASFAPTTTSSPSRAWFPCWFLNHRHRSWHRLFSSTSIFLVFLGPTVVPNNMCKSTSLGPVQADSAKVDIYEDNSSSFINLHLPSMTYVGVMLVIVLVVVFGWKWLVHRRRHTSLGSESWSWATSLGAWRTTWWTW